MSNYQIIIDGEPVSEPMEKEEAAAWEGILTVTFPGTTIESRLIVCPECGEPLPDSGPCWHNLFEEEERPRPTLAEMMAAKAEFTKQVEIQLFGRPIPFKGEPMQPKVITESDEYF